MMNQADARTTHAKPEESSRRRGAPPNYRIVNVVSTADLRQYVDLSALNRYDWGLYDLDIYPAGYIKDSLIQGKVTVFSSGKLISVGANSTKASFSNLNHARRLLESGGIVQKVILRPAVRNIVASVDVGHRIDLHGLVKRIQNVVYEPEQFPGAMVKSKGESPSLIIFASGKVVIAGTKSLPELKMVLNNLSNSLDA